MHESQKANIPTIDRRTFCATGLTRLAAVVSLPHLARQRSHDGVESAPRLAARPRAPSRTASPGLIVLALDPLRDALLHVPKGFDGTTAIPLVLMLHGATMRAESQINLLGGLADEKRFAVLAVKSKDVTWDGIRGDYGPDIAFIDRALQVTFDQVRVDAARVAVGGFSDGASYGLALAISNGDLFSRGIIFSAGFIPPTRPQGKPRLFVSHGTQDQILPIDQCGRRIVAELRRQQYDVEYREFPGRHTVPPEIARAAVEWMG